MQEKVLASSSKQPLIQQLACACGRCALCDYLQLLKVAIGFYFSVNFKLMTSCCLMLSTRGRQVTAQLQLRLQQNTDEAASATATVKSISVRICAAYASAQV